MAKMTLAAKAQKLTPGKKKFLQSFLMYHHRRLVSLTRKKDLDAANELKALGLLEVHDDGAARLTHDGRLIANGKTK